MLFVAVLGAAVGSAGVGLAGLGWPQTSRSVAASAAKSAVVATSVWYSKSLVTTRKWSSHTGYLRAETLGGRRGLRRRAREAAAHLLSWR